MGLFEHWPYVNFHELNLDWLIGKVKNIDNSIEEAAESASAAASSASASAASAAEAKKYAETVVHYDNIILIGDSYAQGWTPDGDVVSWQTNVINSMRRGNPDASFITKAAGGYGFTTAPGFIDLLQTVDDSEAVGCIVVAGGYNDKTATKENIDNAIIAFVTYAKEHFPNSRVLIGACGWITEGLTSGIHVDASYSDLDKVTNQYKLSAVRTGVEYIKNIEYSLRRKTFFSSDYVHPNANGQYQISFAIVNAINGSNQFINEYLTGVYDDITPADNITASASNLKLITSIDNKAATLTLEIIATSITVNGDPSITCNGYMPAGIKIGTFNNPALSLKSDDILAFPCSAVFKTGGASFEAATSIIYIRGHEIWLSVFDVNDAGNNYRTISTIKEIQLRAATTTIRLP